MPTIVHMPQLGESVAEGTIGRWLKQPGDRIERDEPLVEVQTDKVNTEIPSPVAGTVQDLLVAEGETVAVKSEIAVIADGDGVAGSGPAARGGEPAESSGTPAPTSADGGGPSSTPTAPSRQPTFSFDDSPGGGPTSSARVGGEAAEAPAAGGKRFYTPLVLRIAQEHGIDLESIEGTGQGGRVTRRDVERYLETRPDQPGAATPTRATREGASAPPEAVPVPGPAAVGGEERALSPMRRAIATHMSQARRDIPDAWVMVEVDVTALQRFRARVQPDWQAKEGYELTTLPFFVQAVLDGLRAVPELNATWAADRITLHRAYHLGIAVALDQGLVVPVLRDADQYSVAGLARALRILIQKARTGKLTADDLQGATFTVNNPGALGSILSQPIVPVGQAGIVTMEAIVKRPVVTADDAIAIRSLMNCCLSFDHRVLDGAQALRFLRAVKERLEAPEHTLS